MKKDQLTKKSHSLKHAFKAVIACSFLLLSTSTLHAWEKAIWPFNTPSMVSKQICKNSKDWARSAYCCYDQQSRTNLLAKLNSNRNFSIKEDPNYKTWHIIYYREMERLIKTVWKNPNITEKMAVKITHDTCKARRSDIQKELEKTNPKK